MFLYTEKKTLLTRQDAREWGTGGGLWLDARGEGGLLYRFLITFETHIRKKFLSFFNRIFFPFTDLDIFIFLGLSSPHDGILAKRRKLKQQNRNMNNKHANLAKTYLFFMLCLSVCLSVCLYLINVKTAEPIGPKFFVGLRVTPWKV